MKTEGKAILLIICCTIFTSLGQLFFKSGVERISFIDWITFLNLPLIMGFVSYGIGMVFMLLAFARGELSILYPIIATSYVWVSLFSPILFPADSMNPLKWLGVGVIILSVCLIGWSSRGEQHV